MEQTVKMSVDKGQFNQIDKQELKQYFKPIGFQIKMSEKNNICELWHNNEFVTPITKKVDKYSKRLVNNISQRIKDGYVKLEKGTLITLNSTDTYYELLVDGKDIYIKKDRMNWNAIFEDVVHYVLSLDGIRTIIYKRNGNWLMI